MIFSTLSFGAVEPWSLAVAGMLTAVAFSVFATRWQGFTDEPQSKGFFISGAIIIAYGLLQLVPMPLRWLGAIHPALLQLVSMQGAPANLHPVSVYSFATEMELSRLTIYLMIFLMAAFGPRTHEQVHSMLRMLAIFGFFLALFAVTQKATWNGKLYWVRELSYNRGNPLGPFVNKNHFAGWMCMVAPLSFGIGLMSRSMSRRIRYIFFAVVMAITIFFSLSRGGIISFLLGTIILALTVVWGVSSKKSLIPVLSFVVALLGYLIYLGVSPIVQRFVQSGMSSHERLLVWSASMTAFRDFPVFGTGLGTFQHIFPMYKPDGITMFYQHAHNDYVEILLELGISGAFLMLVFLGLAGKHILYVRWRGRERYLKAAFVASLVSIAVFSLFDFNLHIPSNAILLSFILGLAVAMSRFERMADRKKLVLRERPT
ncbi:MAG: O-antigen ligase family protein [Syntrophorhabdales bacterium]